jgi:hypothetical protein
VPIGALDVCHVVRLILHSLPQFIKRGHHALEVLAGLIFKTWKQREYDGLESWSKRRAVEPQDVCFDNREKEWAY